MKAEHYPGRAICLTGAVFSRFLVSFGRGEASYSPSASLTTTEKVALYTHKNSMQSDPLNKHLVLNTGHPFSVLVRSAGQEHLEGDKSYKKYMHGHFTPGGFCP